MQYWLSKGARRDQLLVGMGAYGRGFNLAHPSDHGLYAPATSGIQAGMYTNAAGFWGYNEFCEKMVTEASQWTFVTVILANKLLGTYTISPRRGGRALYYIIYLPNVWRETVHKL
jgi:GH18 family chitinase